MSASTPEPGVDATDGAAAGEALESVTATGMAHGGEAVARLADGSVIFVDGALPGESAVVAVTERRSRFARGRLAELPSTASGDRVDPPVCPHFGRWPERGARPGTWCGACQWQHATYAAQLRFKADLLRDAFQRIGRIPNPPVAPTLGMAEPWGYRNQIRLRGVEDGMGYVAVDGSTVVRVGECPIAHPNVVALMPAVAEAVPPGMEVSLRAGVNTGDQLVVLHGSATEFESIEVELDASVVIADADTGSHVVAGNPYLTEVLGGTHFVIPADSFFQVNTVMAEELVRLLRAAVGGPVARLVDVHSGVGTFAVLLADLAEEVWAIESHGASVAAAVDNAAGLEHLTLVEADAAEGYGFLEIVPDCVVVDPPRAGLDGDFLRLLIDRPPATIAYVSCDPGTLARDAKLLIESGYSLVSSQPVDMFPQTHHVESVNVFRR